MARVRIWINVGSGATLGSLQSVIDDLSVLQDLGLRVDSSVAQRDAENTIERWWRDQPGQINERSLRLDERSLRLDERSLTEIQRLLEQRRLDEEFSERVAGAPPEIWLEEWYRLQRRSLGRRSARMPLMPLGYWSSPAEARLRVVAPDIFEQLVADEAAQHLPSVPTVERLNYENPLELVLIGVTGFLTAAGFKFGTFTELAELIRDWSADKREREAQVKQAAADALRAEVQVRREEAEVRRTDAETREINARASKAEVEAEVLRRYALQGNRVDDLVAVGLAPRELQAIAQLTAGTVDVEVDESAP